MRAAGNRAARLIGRGCARLCFCEAVQRQANQAAFGNRISLARDVFGTSAVNQVRENTQYNHDRHSHGYWLSYVVVKGWIGCATTRANTRSPLHLFATSVAMILLHHAPRSR